MSLIETVPLGRRGDQALEIHSIGRPLIEQAAGRMAQYVKAGIVHCPQNSLGLPVAIELKIRMDRADRKVEFAQDMVR